MLANMLIGYNSQHKTIKQDENGEVYHSRDIKKVIIICYNEYLTQHAYSKYGNIDKSSVKQ